MYLLHILLSTFPVPMDLEHLPHLLMGLLYLASNASLVDMYQV